MAMEEKRVGNGSCTDAGTDREELMDFCNDSYSPIFSTIGLMA